MSDEATADGWDAISAALEKLYPGVEPKHYGTLIKYMLGGPDPIDGISAYKRIEPAPHWHIVTYGFSELYEKQTENAEVSGYGFEMTFRLRCEPDDDEPPMWSMNFLQNIARYVFETGSTFAPGHHMDCNGPICLESETQLTAMCICEDPELGVIETPNGRVRFLQIVGITADELIAVKSWDSLKFLGELNRDYPLGVTDVSRESVLRDPDIQKAVQNGVAKDGSSTGELYVRGLAFIRKGLFKKQTTIVLPAIAAGVVADLLRGRINHDRPLTLIGDDTFVSFEPADLSGTELADGGLILRLSKTDSSAISQSLQAKRGDYSWGSLPDVVVRVQPTEVRNHEGEVIRVIG